MKVSIVTGYTVSIDTTVDLPDDKSWDDVENWYVKWGELNLAFKDGSQVVISLRDPEMPDDMKRPSYAEVRMCDLNGYTNWDADPIATLS